MVTDSAKVFLGHLRDSGLLEDGEFDFVNQIASEAGSDRDAANRLVAEGIVTRWQANKLLAGRHKGFFLGKYRILDHLGSGGMSHVYLAEHVVMKRRVAVKVLPLRRATDPSYLARFYREAQAAAAVHHPNIVHAYDFEQEGRIHFIVMEYVHGKSLQQLVRQRGPMSPEDAARLIQQAAEGLEHAHRAGLVHRDVKPSNILVDNDGTAKLLDLGLALYEQGDTSSLTRQHGHSVLGTADYLAPEQALDSHAVDSRADIYSLGCTMFFLLTGQPPFNEGSVAERIRKHRELAPPPIDDLRAGVPPELAAICYRMMAKPAGERFQTAREAADVLANWLEAQTLSASGRPQGPKSSGDEFHESAIDEINVAAAVPSDSESTKKTADGTPGIGGGLSDICSPTPSAPLSPTARSATPPWIWLIIGAVMGAIVVLTILLLQKR